MSVARLLLSGLLVASGLILGAFTLHGHFAPQWEVHATVPAERETARPPSDLPEERDRAAPSDIVPDRWAPQLVKAEPTTADAKARKRSPEKKVAEKRPAQKKDSAKTEEEPQTVFSWLSSLLADNGK